MKKLLNDYNSIIDFTNLNDETILINMLPYNICFFNKNNTNEINLFRFYKGSYYENIYKIPNNNIIIFYSIYRNFILLKFGKLYTIEIWE